MMKDRDRNTEVLYTMLHHICMVSRYSLQMSTYSILHSKYMVSKKHYIKYMVSENHYIKYIVSKNHYIKHIVSKNHYNKYMVSKNHYIKYMVSKKHYNKYMVSKNHYIKCMVSKNNLQINMLDMSARFCVCSPSTPVWGATVRELLTE